jgi:ATP-dependent exoDNAse (exonuclease V) beta subunit
MVERNKLPDLDARATALTAIDRSLLVEAGAGSGKTSIMAGRVAVLLSHGVEPKNVGAITFTEFAAGELMTRIDRFVEALARGVLPRDLESAFPDGVSIKEKTHLAHAKKTLDQLTCTTIHGFAQALIKPYPVEASIDPGAEIVDPAEADLAFDERYRAWLRERLTGEVGDGIIAELVLADEIGGFKLINEIANFLRRNRDARPLESTWSNAAATQLAKAVTAFSDELGRFDFREEGTETTCRAFAEFVEVQNGSILRADRPTNHALLGAINLPRHASCFTQNGTRRQLRTKGRWARAAGAVGKSKIDGSQAYDAVNSRYEACHDAFETLLSAAAGELLVRLSMNMDGLMKEWRDYKRAAALLEFDDLLYTARDLLAGHDHVRGALAKRFPYVLVDEFQDTDPLQIDILWRLCGEPGGGRPEDPLARAVRPGALFLVGDPKQAIYRFRGADVNAYVRAREAIGSDALVKITANFRSVEPILDLVNTKFKTALSEAAGQPGFTELSSTRKLEHGDLAVAALDVGVDADEPNAAMFRDAEANRVANLCSRLVGNRQVRDPATGAVRPCQFGDIALLAPVGTDLWRFEEALEERGIAVSSQAGKGFFRRQETQDLIALTRSLADARDTLSLGALLRGPLVGLSEAELLDIAEALPVDPDRPGRPPQLNLWTELDSATHQVACSVLECLQSLAKRARAMTPYMLLSDAVSMLDVRPQLQQRFRAGADRALANVDLFLEMSRAYDVRGLRAFARDMRANWEEAVRQVEGRPDAEKQSVALITIHAAKGLEWPIVIPINMTGMPKSETGLAHDRRSNGFSIPVLGVAPAGHEAVATWNEQELARERVRLWYVAATRARDLLVLPLHSAKLPDGSWAQVVDLDLSSLPAIDPDALGDVQIGSMAALENMQTRTIFAEEAGRIAKVERGIHWQRPSRGELEASPPSESEPVFVVPEAADEAVEVRIPDVAGGATRGTVLHKLVEEVLTGETTDAVSSLTKRATELLSQLGISPTADAKLGLAPVELAETVAKTLHLPEVAALRPRLVPEHTIYGWQMNTKGEVLVSGIADAVAADPAGNIEIIVDWKSDVVMNAGKLNAYRGQLDAYRKNTGAARALLVLMTAGTVIELA